MFADNCSVPRLLLSSFRDVPLLLSQTDSRPPCSKRSPRCRPFVSSVGRAILALRPACERVPQHRPRMPARPSLAQRLVLSRRVH